MKKELQRTVHRYSTILQLSLITLVYDSRDHIPP